MATDRATLHLSKVGEFAAWLERRGWVAVPTRGEYEVLRMRHPEQAKPLILYARDRTDHATFGYDQASRFFLVKLWLRERRQRDGDPH